MAPDRNVLWCSTDSVQRSPLLLGQQEHPKSVLFCTVFRHTRSIRSDKNLFLPSVRFFLVFLDSHCVVIVLPFHWWLDPRGASTCEQSLQQLGKNCIHSLAPC